MDARVRKLTQIGLSKDVAKKLVAAGLATPALIRVATKKELDAAGVKASDVVAIRKR